MVRHETAENEEREERMVAAGCTDWERQEVWMEEVEYTERKAATQ
jgi:hypothetical protein